MAGEFVGQCVGRIGDNRLAIGQHLRLAEEVADEIEIAVINQIAGEYYVAMIAQDAHDRTATGGGLPYPKRQ